MVAAVRITVVKIEMVQDVVTPAVGTPNEPAPVLRIAQLGAQPRGADTVPVQVLHRLAQALIPQVRLQRKLSRPDRPTETQIDRRSRVLDRGVEALRVAVPAPDAR